MMNIKHSFSIMTSRSWPLASLGALITTVGGVISHKFCVYFSLQVKLASLILFVKGVAPYVFLFVVYGLDQIRNIFISEAVLLINSYLSNNLWANSVLLVGFILLLIDSIVIKKVISSSSSWLSSTAYDRSRWFLMILLINYLVWGLLMVFMNKLAHASLFAALLFLWTHIMSAYLLNCLEKLNMKRFWIYVSVIKFITLVIIIMLKVFTSLEKVYFVIGWSPELVDFYTQNVMTLAEWPAMKWFLFLIPFSQLVLPFQGVYQAVGMGAVGFCTSKVGSFSIELDLAVKQVFGKKSYQFQSTMLFLEHISINKEGNSFDSVLKMDDIELKTTVSSYNSKMPAAQRPQWEIKYKHEFKNQIRQLEQIFSKVSQADKDIKLALTGKGQAAFHHYKFCDQNSGYTLGISSDLWSSFVRGSSYGKLLIPNGLTSTHVAPWSYTFMDTAYKPRSQSSDAEKIFQLVRETDTASLFMQQVKVDSLERPPLMNQGDAIIRIKDIVIYADFKALTIQPQYSIKWNTVLNSPEQNELRKQFSERSEKVEAYFEKEHIKNAMALVLANKMIAPDELGKLNSSLYGESNFLTAEKRHTIVAYSPVEE